MDENLQDMDPVDNVFDLPVIGHVDIIPEKEPTTGEDDSIDATKDSEMIPGKRTEKNEFFT